MSCSWNSNTQKGVCILRFDGRKIQFEIRSLANCCDLSEYNILLFCRFVSSQLSEQWTVIRRLLIFASFSSLRYHRIIILFVVMWKLCTAWCMYRRILNYSFWFHSCVTCNCRNWSLLRISQWAVAFFSVLMRNGNVAMEYISQMEMSSIVSEINAQVFILFHSLEPPLM